MFSIKEVKSEAKGMIKKHFGSVLFLTILLMIIQGAFSYQYEVENTLMNLGMTLVGFILVTYFTIGYYSALMGYYKFSKLKMKEFFPSIRTLFRYILFTILILLFSILVALFISIIILISSTLFVMNSYVPNIDSVFTGSEVLPVQFILAMLGVFIIIYLPLIYISIIYIFTPFLLILNEDDIDTLSAMKMSRILVKNNFWRILWILLSIILYIIVPVIVIIVSVLMIETNKVFLFVSIGAAIVLGIILLYILPYYTFILISIFKKLMVAKRDKVVIYRIVKPDNIMFFDENCYEEVMKSNFEEVVDVKPEEIVVVDVKQDSDEKLDEVIDVESKETEDDVKK